MTAKARLYERESDEWGYYDPENPRLTAAQLARRGYHKVLPYGRAAYRLGERGYGLGERAFERGFGVDFGKVLSQSAIAIGIYVMLSMLWRAYRGYKGLFDVGKGITGVTTPLKDLKNPKQIRDRIMAAYKHKQSMYFGEPSEEAFKEYVQTAFPEYYDLLYNEQGEPTKESTHDPEEIGDWIFINYFIYVIIAIPIIVLLFNLYSVRRERKLQRLMR